MTATMTVPYNGKLPAPGPWILRAACLGISGERGYDDFFGDDAPSDVAVTACASCVVRDECLQYALTYDPHGYWGGMTQTERRSLLRRRAVRSGPTLVARHESQHRCPGCRSERSMPLGGGHRECADCGARWPT